jgi:hypothetical protein
MLPNRTPSAPEVPAPHSVRGQRSAVLRSRTTNDPSSRFSLNTAEGRRARDLFEAFVALMGNPTEMILLSQALTAAELVAAAEMARAALLAGTGDIDQVIRLENLSARATRKLRLPSAAAAPAAAPSLAQYIATRAAATPAAPQAPAASAVPAADEAHHEAPQRDGEASGE